MKIQTYTVTHKGEDVEVSGYYIPRSPGDRDTAPCASEFNITSADIDIEYWHDLEELVIKQIER